jgi:hypothetical protein
VSPCPFSTVTIAASAEELRVGRRSFSDGAAIGWVGPVLRCSPRCRRSCGSTSSVPTRCSSRSPPLRDCSTSRSGALLTCLHVDKAYVLPNSCHMCHRPCIPGVASTPGGRCACSQCALICVSRERRVIRPSTVCDSVCDGVWNAEGRRRRGQDKGLVPPGCNALRRFKKSMPLFARVGALQRKAAETAGKSDAASR